MNSYFKSRNYPMERINSQQGEPQSKMVVQCQKNDTNALENYSSWLQKRHEIHLKLNKKINRGSGDLLMNMGDEYNEVKEEKAGLEYTRIPQHFDKYRGNPKWWTLPPSLHDKCTCRPDRVKYFYQKTKEQKNEIPEIERIGLPYHIKSEKMLLPRTRNMYEMWQNLKFRKQKVEEVDDLLKNILPHKPVFENLIVLGNKIYPSKDSSQKTSVSVRTSSDFVKKVNTSVYDLSLRICLKINGVYLYENSPSVATSRKFYVLFECDVQSSPLHTKHITFENIGRVTLRIYWKEMKKFRLFRDFHKQINNESFCFDKNMLVLVPGQILNFPIWFQTTKVCTVMETWEISTVPKFWKDTVQVFFILQAQSHIENFMKRIRDIKANINHTVKRRIIKEILEEATEKTKYENYKTIRYSYYEPELFESLNFENGDVDRKPKYSYDKYIVEQLKNFYAEVRQEFHPKTWNMNIEDLKVVTRVKDLIEYAEERTRQYSQYRLTTIDQQQTEEVPADKSNKIPSNHQIKTKNRRASILKPPRESSIHAQDQFSHKETRYGTLMKLIAKLVAPSISPNAERLKYFHVYSILCSYFTLMSSYLYDIKPFFNQSNNFVHNTCQNCPRLIFEKFDDLQLVRTKRALCEDSKAQPKPAVLNNISTDDVQKIYMLYFKKTAQDFPKGVKKKAKAKKPVKEKKAKKTKKKKSDALSTTSSKTDLIDEKLTIANFDPYSEDNTMVNIKRFEGISSSTVVAMDENVSNYSSTTSGFLGSVEVQCFNMYVIIYSCLQDAVDAVVDCLESEKEHKVPHENLEQLRSCFSLFIEDETCPDVPPINPFSDPEDREYYERILRAHLNDLTGKYLVCGKTEPWSKPDRKDLVGDTTMSISIMQQKKQSLQVAKSASVFTLPRIQPVEITFSERSAQTLEDYISCDEQSLHKTTESEPPSELDEIAGTEAAEQFYFCDDSVDNYEIPVSTKLPNDSYDVVSPLNSQEEVASMKTDSKPKAPVSLLKEWIKKKCSVNDMEKNDEK
ncbi:hypothetical protein WA026_019695 [Henosepilachna vigintioctopunctata]|uniref:Uncharacterized protein n=1 Tax=Henosepilachna vigintioctopunctata TaxID=420089 RepID=A0AAW1UQR6_9CUCU